jgi:DNA-directed RNA polymerase subunit K/omega
MMKSTVVENKFLKVLIIAQRAKQIQKGAVPLINGLKMRATRTAREEVEHGLIGFEFMDVHYMSTVLEANANETKKLGVGESSDATGETKGVIEEWINRGLKRENRISLLPKSAL